MTRIDPGRQLLGLVRSRVSDLQSRAGTQKKGASSPAASSGSVSSSLVQRIRGLSPEDPQRRRTAVRLFLESELAREFGDAALNDPAFPQMLEAVQEQMAQDAKLAAAVEKLGDWLLAGGQPASSV